ncbi:Uncharacterized Fe-S protein [Serratia ficaria]|uniref:IucA/IucC family C-terminal-domain containing protein n=1 Tax=Enterobacterales TaxID=91347 RepID=UPI000F7EF9B6|nr:MULTISPECIES: IucA/IucC family C-terminal-domain containing protein [Enterobacterales]RSV87639.1 siderophore-iron reductase, Fe-S cluster protein [Klebsiella aerogenes]CAI1971990.1 Uncharacterized Fe-S protein [Serratia ficaria]
MTFSQEQWAQLSGGLLLTTAAQADPARSLPAVELLDDACCEQLLRTLTPTIGSPSLAITASLLAKRVSFLTTGACLYAMSAYDQGLRLSLDNALIEYGHDDGRWTSKIPLHNISPFGYQPDEREMWRAEIVTSLFAGLLAPLWQTFSRVAGISARILWENSAVRVYSLYERRMAKIDDELIRKRCETDFFWLCEQAEPALFGLDINPLRHFRRPATAVEGQACGVRFRRTCCFYYKASIPIEYCSTCPLLKPGKNV